MEAEEEKEEEEVIDPNFEVGADHKQTTSTISPTHLSHIAFFYNKHTQLSPTP